MKVLCIGFVALALCGLAAAADDALQTNSDALRAAVDGKKGVTEIRRLSLLVFAEAKKAEGPAPADADKDYWAEHAKYAQQCSEYAEYALYSASVGAPAATAADLIATLEAQAPKSKYLSQDVYVAAAFDALRTQENDRASALARKALTAPKGAKPEQADAQAHYIVGMVAATKKDNATADKELRAALAGIKGSPAQEGPALYYLGEADYALGRQSMDRQQADQGIKFMLQSALISGPYQSGAATEARRMKTELGEK